MYELAIYSFKAGVCLAAFYLFFKLLLSRETLHRFNRIVLLGAVALSFLLPLCVITVVRELPALPELPLAVGESTPAEPAPEPFPWDRLLAAVFAAGAVVTLGRMVWSTGCVMRLVRRGRCERLDDGAVLAVLAEEVMPFSWGRYIVLSERDYAESGREILIHERAHLRLHHTWDLLLTDLAGCLQWFNPAMWLLRRELRAIHEYEADEAVLRSGVDAKHYQLMLIKKAAGGRWYSVANSFNHSKLKNRITMMLQKRSSRWACAKALFVLPLTGIALASFARTAYVVPDDKVKKESVTVQVSDGNISLEGVADEPIIVVDGKRASADALQSDRIASVRVVKGDAATAEYGQEGKNGVIEVTLKKEGAEADTLMQKVVVVSSEGTQTMELIGQADLGTAGKVVSIRSRKENVTGEGPVFILDGEAVSEERIEALQPGDIAGMNVDKRGTAANNGVVFITTKAAARQAQQGLEAAREGLKAGEEGLEAARAALETARKHMSKKEWKRALKQLDDAQKQLSEAREEMNAAEPRVTKQVIESSDGKQVTIRMNKQSGKTDAAVEITTPDAGKESSVTIASGSMSYELLPELMNEKLTVYIDGQKADMAKLKKTPNGKILRMNVYKGEAAVSKYGEEARNGVIEITTK